MQLDELRAWFSDRGMPFEWRLDTGPGHVQREAALICDDPVDLAGYPLIIVIPDLHLGSKNDIFRYNSSSHAGRLDSFLGLLISLRREIGYFPVIQIGDFYDFYRVTPGATFDEGSAEIERNYPSIIAKAGELGILAAIGNHDAAFLRKLSYLESKGIQGAAAHFAAGSAFFHGAAIKSDMNAEYWLRVVNAGASIPLIGPAVNFLQRELDDSFADSIPGSSFDEAWPVWLGDSPVEWDAPWVARSGADGLVAAACEFASQARLPAPSLVFVGHSHRPGISCGRRSDGVWIPVIDVGSWTYGRAEFGVMGQNAIGLGRFG